MTLTKRHLIPFICLCILCIGFYFTADKHAVRQTNLELFQLDPMIKEKFITLQLLKDLVLINFNKNDISYYYEGNSKLRLEPLLRELEEIASSQPNSIPDGNYFVSLHDGIQQAASLPLIAFAANNNLVNAKKIILIPDYTAIQGYENIFKQIDKQSAKYPWKDRIPKIFWRGATTGATKYITDVHQFSRGKFLELAKQHKFVDAGFTTYTKNITTALRKQLQDNFILHKNIPPQEAIAYKYLLDIDGNSCSYSRMAWILYSRSLLLKQTSDNMQWYYPHLKPYIHYVPLNNDFSDIEQKFAWIQQHPLSSITMASNARILAEKIFNHSAIRTSIINAFNDYHAILQ